MSIIRSVPNLTDQVYQLVVDEICDGILPAGSHLVQERLAERFGVSRQPVQQAIALLKADGLIEEIGKRGMQVAALDLAMMRAHYQLRGTLDALAAQLAAKRAAADPNLAAEIDVRGREIIRRGFKAVHSGSVPNQIQEEAAFHFFVYEISGNPLMTKSAEPHWRYLRRAIGDRLRETPQPESIWKQHEEILDAVISGQPGLAEKRALEHVRLATEMLVETFSPA
ncbi:GntR family transcriptional regulator [Hwanghaeella grinnelliae]|uniref:GntR family transcriptional regulator n=1 Tax=Hwanghaeella grinnelliae TaxID=2500179 RepID=A0A3S2WB01_9PROT|nr:GntR family transcriptional regulator [Hwanghaeella grinnelliae]RVU38274.1 GntR family transcriptional regulator [Hwanghaeella grinnelliae]